MRATMWDLKLWCARGPSDGAPRTGAPRPKEGPLEQLLKDVADLGNGQANDDLHVLAVLGNAMRADGLEVGLRGNEGLVVNVHAQTGGAVGDVNDVLAPAKQIEDVLGKNLALNFLERQKREMPTDFEEESYRYGTSETELPFIFEAARKILSEEEYEILMLCQVAGYKRREVSAMLSMPIATVTWKNNEALKKLKKYLEKEGGR